MRLRRRFLAAGLLPLAFALAGAAGGTAAAGTFHDDAYSACNTAQESSGLVGVNMNVLTRCYGDYDG
ncbi:hypothetical protein ACFPZ0_12470 [Streptomonospora nanhaiensis]|uniref:Uncharacterized protein n=1 Tax=Streptomonospora nanhaiensis TaxID=1323731 RepID=A0A853BN77_9ACTN|nr:hypothetical protein [Streptomonospora nanhaiensis]MBV2363424.1 hypothetical protein [Streptomonospora nanhaiensis]MBX9387658.1 hypothetical protein [Streptomonospora nanhaiensis]NYI96918.1 hypothetical protein [Streptomonospora nanhaiensis]